MRSTTKLLALSVLLAPACELIELEDEVVDTGDTAVDSADEGPQPEASAYVRFINVVDGQALSLDGAFNANDGVRFDFEALNFTQGTDYVDVGAGAWTLTLSDGEREAVSALELADDGHYTLAALRDPQDPGALAQLVVLEDTLSADAAVAADHARISWVHAMALDGTYAGQVYTGWDSGDEAWYSAGPTSGTMFLDPHGAISWEYPMVTTPTYIFGQWGVPTELPQIALEVDAFIQVGQEELVNVFLTCTGDCAPEDSFVLGQFEDGSTATTQGCEVYATVDDQLEISDCP